MFANSSELLSQIRAIVQEKSSSESSIWSLDFSSIKKIIQNSKDSLSSNSVVKLNRSQLKKIEERIQKLEDQGDQLLCIFYLLFDKISNHVLSSGENNLTRECGRSIKKEVLTHVENKQKPELTKRETDVFNLLEQGLCAKEIAKILFISETTVITHKRNLKEKFNAKNTVELISKVLAK